MQVQRTLVKSPPELWAEVSDIDALTRHLGEFGEIRITRVVPETEVAWEGEAASGTVELDASGWGTKVTLTAELSAAATIAEPDPVVEAEPEPVAVVEPEPVAVVEPEPVAVVEPEPEPVTAEPEPVAVTEPEPKTRRGFFVRLRRRRPPKALAATAAKPPVAIDLPNPPSPGPGPAPPVPVPDPAPQPDPLPPPDPVPPDPVPDPGPDPAPPQISAPDPGPDLEAVLTGVLDDLGAAHHRPFSRS